MKNNGIELEILVNGITLPEYLHEGNFYIEGREDYEFDVKIKNNTFKRILAVPSIDGRSVMNGELASTESSGYVLRPYSEYKIVGWRRPNNETVAKFTFGKISYAERLGDSGTNNGVIGVLVYDEKVKPVYRRPDPYDYPRVKSARVGMSFNSCSTSASASYGAASASCDSAPRGIASTGGFSLGTDYGREVSDQVSTTTFDRGAMLAEFKLFYAPIESLTAWGINMTVPSVPPLPKPFVGVGCPEPPGWTGKRSPW